MFHRAPRWSTRRTVATTSLRRFVGVALLLACSADSAAPAPDVGDVAVPEETASMRRDAGEGRTGARDSSTQSAREDGATDAVDRDASAGDSELTARGETLADSGPSPTRGRTSVVLHERWTRVGPSDDPFDDRPQLVECAASAVMAETLNEESVFSVETEACNYLTVVQPTLRAIALGDMLKVRLWHFELSADEPVEAHAALQVEGMRFFDERIPIPSPGGLVSRQLEATRAIPAGTPIYFHLHNHGSNSWSLVEVSAGP